MTLFKTLNELRWSFLTARPADASQRVPTHPRREPLNWEQKNVIENCRGWVARLVHSRGRCTSYSRIQVPFARVSNLASRASRYLRSGVESHPESESNQITGEEGEWEGLAVVTQSLATASQVSSYSFFFVVYSNFYSFYPLLVCFKLHIASWFFGKYQSYTFRFSLMFDLYVSDTGGYHSRIAENTVHPRTDFFWVL